MFWHVATPPYWSFERRPVHIHPPSASNNLRIACHYLHFTSIEDIYLKSSILGLSSILRVSGSYLRKRGSENSLNKKTGPGAGPNNLLHSLFRMS